MAVTPSGKDKILPLTRVYIGGYDLSGDAREISSIDATHAEADMTGFSNEIFNYQPGRMTAGMRGFKALMNDDTAGAWTQLKTPGNTARQLSICFGGGGVPAAGDPAYHLPAVQMSNPVNLDGNAWVVGADFVPDAQQMTSNFRTPWGYVLRGAVSMSATLTASSSNSIDLGAAMANGWTAIIHILASSSGNFALTIKHSTDDSSFATLGTFTTTGGAVGSELLSGATTVNRYVAFNAVRTAGTVTAVVTFVPNTH